MRIRLGPPIFTHCIQARDQRPQLDGDARIDFAEYYFYPMGGADPARVLEGRRVGGPWHPPTNRGLQR